MAEAVATGPSETARVEAFSDAVFAIAITLLVLEIRVPSPDVTGHGSTLLPALLRLWPSYLGYLISFVTIGVMWVNHHSMFVLIRQTDRYFLLLSVFFLMCIAFLPFPRAFWRSISPSRRGGELRSRRTARPSYS
jgi:uncharacterized membrane protein